MKKIGIFGFLAVFSAAMMFPSDIYGQRDREAERRERERQELMRQLERLQSTREREETRVQQQTGGAGTEQTIAQFQNYYDNNCVGAGAGRNRSRCADALFSIAANHHRDGRDNFVRAQNEFEMAMTRWERARVGERPRAPRPDYSLALTTFQTAVERYAGTPRAADGWFQIGSIYLLDGDVNNAFSAFEQLTVRYPTSNRASAAHFRMAEICFSDRNDLRCALANLDRMRMEHVTDDIVEMAHFRRAEIHHRNGNLDEAVRLFAEYVDKCARREFPRCELRGEAIDLMAMAFSDMDNGADAALEFFRRTGTRSYEDTIIYRVGMRNFDHGQHEQAIRALSRAIERFPLFVDAPRAQMNVVNAHVIRRRAEEANRERERLVSYFSPGGAWARANAGNPIALAISVDMVKQALSAMAVHNHAQAQQATDPQVKAAHFAKAIEYYERLIRDFPEDVWMVYEFSFNLAEAYMSVGRFEAAAERYNFVAFADLSRFPVFRAEIDTMGLSAADIERARAEGSTRTSPINISQADAGWNAIVALDTLRREQIAQGNLTPQQAYALPLTRKYLDHIRNFQVRFPDADKAAEALYAAASVHFEGENFREAISVSMMVLSAYGASDSSMWHRATKLLADSYAKNEQFDLAIEQYNALLARVARDSENFRIYTDLAAAAIFQKAEGLRRNRQVAQAAAEFRSIVARYPTSTVAPLGWFEAAITYEQADSAQAAALIFAEFPTRFPQHELRQAAFVRAGENFAKAEMFAEAGKIMITAAETVNQAEFSIGALGVGAGYFRSAGDITAMGDMYFRIFRMFPTDPQAPQALYNAGLAFEESGEFARAIEAYTILGTRYADSEFAPSGYFSIGLVYEKMGDYAKMAEAFVNYARRFTSNRDSQIKALNRAGRAFLQLDRVPEAEENFLLATQIFTRFRESDALANEDGAIAFFNLAEIYRSRFGDIKLTGRQQRDVEAAAKRKQEAFQQLAETYMNAAQLAIAEWTIRSVYSVGLAAMTYAENFRNQTLFGREDVRLGTRIQILSNFVHQFYDEAITNFARSVQLARESGIRANYVRDAEMHLSQAWFMKGRSFEEAGDMVRNSPIPAGLDDEEQMAFLDAVEEFYMNFVKQALPVFVAGIDNMTSLFVGRNEWTDTIQTRIALLAAELDVAGFAVGELAQAEIDLDAEVARARADGRFVEVSEFDVARRQAQADHEQAMAAINNIVTGNMVITERLSALASRRTNTDRAIAEENARILELRRKLEQN